MGEDTDSHQPLHDVDFHLKKKSVLFSGWLMNQRQLLEDLDQLVQNDDFFFTFIENSTQQLETIDRRLLLPTRSTHITLEGNTTRIVPAWHYLGFSCSDSLDQQWLQQNGTSKLIPFIRSLKQFSSFGPKQVGTKKDVEHIVQEIRDRVQNPHYSPSLPTNVFNVEETVVQLGVQQVTRTLNASPSTPEIVVVVGRLYPHDYEGYEDLIEHNHLPITSLRNFV